MYLPIYPYRNKDYLTSEGEKKWRRDEGEVEWKSISGLIEYGGPGAPQGRV
jgi:hypothetical protein